MADKKISETLSIGQVAKILSIHEQTIRAYERKGLIKPSRTIKQTRTFTKNDITRIMIIIVLTQELGLNLAGVKIMLDFAQNNRVNDDALLDFIDDYKSNCSQN